MSTDSYTRLWTHLKGKFARGGGYGAFSVSHSDVVRVARYIANQEERVVY